MDIPSSSDNVAPVRPSEDAPAPSVCLGKFMRIPLEMVLSIAKFLEPVDLNSLIKTTRLFARLLTSRLYDVAATPPYYSSTLLWAVEHSMPSVMEKVLDRDAETLQNQTDCPFLHAAILRGDELVVRLLIDRGAPVSAPNPDDGLTPLHVATCYGLTAIARMLLEAGAGIDIEDDEGDTPLHLAASESDTSVIQLLLEFGADTSLLGFDGGTPLHCAALCGHTAVAQVLLDYGADVRAVDDERDTPAHLAASNGREAVLRLLLDSGASPSIPGYSNSTPLHRAALRRASAVIPLLLSYGANTSALNQAGETPLHSAIDGGDAEALRLLLESGADAFTPGRLGRTPLQYASHLGHRDQVTLLLGAGADVSALDRFGDTVLHNASRYGREELIRILLDSGASVSMPGYNGWTPLHIAASMGNEAATRALLRAGANISARDEGDRTPLHLAILKGNERAAEFILGAGAELSLKDKEGDTELHRAARVGSEEVVRLLLRWYRRENLDLPGRCYVGNSVLDKAVIYGHESIVNLLIKEGVDVTGSHDGCTALHLAVINGHPLVVRLLLSHGADPHHLDLYGRSPMDWASVFQPSLDMMPEFSGEYLPTSPAVAKSTLRKSIVMLATRLLTQERSESLYGLGKCLIYANNFQAAGKAFALQAEPSSDTEDPPYGHTSCDICAGDLKVSTGRFVCQICPEVDICSHCMAMHNIGQHHQTCREHQFLEIQESHREFAGDQLTDPGESRKQWLESLVALYGLSDLDVDDSK